MQFCMFHDRISAWNKIKAKFRCTIYPFAVFWDMAGNLQMTTPLIINGQVAAFSSNYLLTSCVLPIQDLSRNLKTMMIPSSPLKLIT